MALINLYTATTASSLYGTETFSPSAMSVYLHRHDAVYYETAVNSIHRIYRDGTVVRIRRSYSATTYKGYDADTDLLMTYQIGGLNVYDDPISFAYDPSKPASLSYGSILSLAPLGAVVWKGVGYRISGSVVYKFNIATGASLGSFTVTGALSFSADRLAITPSGKLVLIDCDNGSYGVARFYNIPTGQVLYESTFARSKFATVDTANENIWSIGYTDNLMRVYSFKPAPSVFNPFTVSANRSLYRQDTITATLKGSNGELIRDWPVEWVLTGPGTLQEAFSTTDSNGVVTNVYRGPQTAAEIGLSVTIEAWTGY